MFGLFTYYPLCELYHKSRKYGIISCDTGIKVCVSWIKISSLQKDITNILFLVFRLVRVPMQF